MSFSSPLRSLFLGDRRFRKMANRRRHWLFHQVEGLEARTLLTTPTLTNLSISPLTAVYGQAVVLTATVTATTGTPTGSVQFQVDGSNFGNSVSLVNGVATLPDSVAVAGNHTVHAFFSDWGGSFGASQDQLSSGLINTVAGNGFVGYGAGFSGDGGAASNASLAGPQGIAVDSSGNIYFADSGSHRIREIVKETGTIITVAGNGTSGFSGDGGAATSASLRNPYGIAVDSSGNIFVADYLNDRIREIVKETGTIITVAGNGTSGFSGDGGAATSASLGYPQEITVDSDGNLFIADTGNQRVREVVKATGIIVTVAGTGAYGFSGDGGAATSAVLDVPRGMTVDTSGNLYIIDAGNERIREVVKATGIIMTVAGNGGLGFSGDGGAATNAWLCRPTGITIDSSGNLYIADTDNNRIRKVIKATGTIISVAGNGSSGMSGDGGAATKASVLSPYGIAVDSSGNLYLGDSSNNRIRMVAQATGTIMSVAGVSGDGGQATGTSISHPRGIAVDSVGNLYIADAENQRIREVVKATGKMITFAGNGIVGFYGDGGVASSAMLSYPQGIAVDSADNLYIADTGNECVREVVKATGKIITVAGSGNSGFSGDGGAATSAWFNYPTGLTVDSSGNLYIADTSNHRIREVEKATGKIFTVAGNGTNGFSGDGCAAITASMSYPYGITVDSVGNLYIADTYNNRIREVVKASGNIMTVAGTGTGAISGDGGPATNASLNRPYGVTVDSSGNLFIADYSNSCVREVVQASGNIITVAGTGAIGFRGDGGPASSAWVYCPFGVTLDSSGNLYIADFQNYRIREVQAPSFTVTAAATSSLLTTSLPTSVSGQTVTFTATVSANSPSTAVPTGGTVQFLVDGTNFGSPVSLVNGVASWSSSSLTVGQHSIMALYTGDGLNFTGSTAPAVVQTVNVASSTTTLVSSLNPSVFGDSVRFTATVTAGATGTVTFKDGPTTLGTVYIGGGLAIFITSTLAVGNHGIRAEYSGDGNFTGSAASAITQTVNLASTSLRLASSWNPSGVGQSVTFTATITGGARGVITFYDGALALGTGLIRGNTAKFSTDSLSAGSHAILAVFDGDVNHPASTSAVLTQTVDTVPSVGSATFLQRDTATLGNWKSSYGAEGFNISQDGSVNNPSNPAYATVNIQGALNTTWTGSTADVHALQKGASGSTDRIAAAWYNNNVFSVNVSVTDNQTHQVALYLLDWENYNRRTEIVQVQDSFTGAILNSQSLAEFGNGVYLVWSISGNVTFNVINTGSSNAVLSGLFFGGAKISTSPATAGFVKTDSTTQGNWSTAYGADGFGISQEWSTSNPSIPAYATVNVQNALSHIWNGYTYDERALQMSGTESTYRIAAAWYSSDSLSFNVRINDGKSHQVALYALDWDHSNRSEMLQVIDTVSGVILDSRPLTGFQNGVYLAWNVSGNVTFRIKSTGYSNAVISGIFFGGTVPPPLIPTATANLANRDYSTAGNWRTAYGFEGFDISQDPSANNPSLPGYATVSILNASSTIWNASTSDVWALQTADVGSSNRIAACWTNPDRFSINVRINDGKTHQVALYVLDWDHSHPTETIQVIDTDTGIVLDRQSAYLFEKGEYLSWYISGNVTFKVIGSQAGNAVISGLFFGGGKMSGTASFVETNTTTQGNWLDSYGVDGFDINQDPSANNPSIPAYATVNTQNTSSFTWTASTSDLRALQKSAVGSKDRIAATWYDSNHLSISVGINDHKTHQVALYVLDWDNAHRTQTIQVLDTATGMILDSRPVTGFQNGVYLVWNITDSVTFKVVNTGPGNAVLSGLFFGGEVPPLPPTPDPTSTAEFVKTDSTTQGDWKGVYGVNGFDICQDPSINNPSIPAYATLDLENAKNIIWNTLPYEWRALQTAAVGSTKRIAAAWYGNALSLNLGLNDGNTHQLALYALDWDYANRTELIQVIDTASGVILDSRSLSEFQYGIYLVWNIKGNVTYKVINTGPGNAVISGVFLD